MERTDEAELDPPKPRPSKPEPSTQRQSRGERRRTERATRIRHARLGAAGAALGTVAAIVAVWMVTGWRGVTLDAPLQPAPSTSMSSPAELSQPSPAVTARRVTARPTAASSPMPSQIARRMAAALSPVSRLGLDAADPTFHTSGFAPLCGSESRGAPEYLVGFVTRVLTGTRAGEPVTIVQSEAVYRPGGVEALLAESTGVFCAGYVDAPPGSPEGSVLLRGRAGGTVIDYLVAPTSARTALYVEASAASDDAISDVVNNVLPGLIADARSDAADLIAATPGA
jgi:hypothetical protein